MGCTRQSGTHIAVAFRFRDPAPVLAADVSTDASRALTTLEKALGTVATDKRKSDRTQVDKQRAMEQYDRTFSTTANLLSS